MLKIIENINEFEEAIKGKVLVDFFATWCGPCRMLAPILEDISKEHDVIKVDIDNFEELAVRYGIESIPTVISFENGEIKNRRVGFGQKADILKLL